LSNRRVRVVWNRKAGSKAGIPTNAVSEEELRGILDRHGLGGDLRAPGSEEEARAAVRDAVVNGVDVVVAAGGDGTVALVADVLVDTPVALGILPLGSAMNVARSLGIPRELDAAAAIVATAPRRAIDVGFATGRPFHEAVSVGLSAQLFAEAQRIDDDITRPSSDCSGSCSATVRRPSGFASMTGSTRPERS
jgi:diacylglycerol kinase family enzyme